MKRLISILIALLSSLFASATVSLSLTSATNYIFTIPIATNRIEGRGMGATRTSDYATARAEDIAFLQEAWEERFRANRFENEIYPEVGLVGYSKYATGFINDMIGQEMFFLSAGWPKISDNTYTSKYIKRLTTTDISYLSYLPLGAETGPDYKIDGKTGAEYVFQRADVLWTTNDVTVPLLQTPGTPVTAETITNAYRFLDRCDMTLFFSGGMDRRLWLRSYVQTTNDVTYNLPVHMTREDQTQRAWRMSLRQAYVWNDNQNRPVTNFTLWACGYNDTSKSFLTNMFEDVHNFNSLNEWTSATWRKDYGVKIKEQYEDGSVRCERTQLAGLITEDHEYMISVANSSRPFVIVPIHSMSTKWSPLPDELDGVMAMYAHRTINESWSYKDEQCGDQLLTTETNRYAVGYFPVKLTRASNIDMDALSFPIKGYNAYWTNWDISYAMRILNQRFGSLANADMETWKFIAHPQTEYVAAAPEFVHEGDHVYEQHSLSHVTSLNLEMFVFIPRVFNARIITPGE